MSLHAEMSDWLENSPRVGIRTWDETDAIPTDYAGTHFRSRLEAGWATTLDGYGIRWEYEPEKVRLMSGKGYVPDFRLPELATVIEVKGPHMHRLDKTREYARQVYPDTVVLIGYSPQSRMVNEWARQSLMQWGHPLGYAAVFAACGPCGARQWCCPRQSVRCRKCGELFTTGHFAGNGEMRFEGWKEETSWEPFALCPGSVSTTVFTRTPRCWRHPWQQGACGRPLARGQATISPMASWQITCSCRSAAPQSLRPSWSPRGCGSVARTAGSSTSGRRKTRREWLWKPTARQPQNDRSAGETVFRHGVTHTVTPP